MHGLLKRFHLICVSPDEALPKGETYMLLEVFHKLFSGVLHIAVTNSYGSS